MASERKQKLISAINNDAVTRQMFQRIRAESRELEDAGTLPRTADELTLFALQMAVELSEYYAQSNKILKDIKERLTNTTTNPLMLVKQARHGG